MRGKFKNVFRSQLSGREMMKEETAAHWTFEGFREEGRVHGIGQGQGGGERDGTTGTRGAGCRWEAERGALGGRWLDGGLC